MIAADSERLYQLKTLYAAHIPKHISRTNYLAARRLNASKVAIADYFGISRTALHRLLNQWELEDARQETQALYGTRAQAVFAAEAEKPPSFSKEGAPWPPQGRMSIAL
ncbi:MAG: hypothetical protein IMW91_03465 [Firmicutes bacterium]|nr:hypothetical protein [Bacillota bacterium]